MIHSILNVKLVGKKKIIRVEKILREEKDFVVVSDSKGKEHKLYRIDFVSGDLDKIKPGSKVGVLIREEVTGLFVVFSEKTLAETAWDDIDIPIPGYLWACKVCRKRGVVSCEEGDEPSGYIREIKEAHQKATPGCASTNIRILNHEFVEQTDMMAIIALKKA